MNSCINKRSSCYECLPTDHVELELWEEINFHAPEDNHFVQNGILNAATYIRDITEEYVALLAPFVEETFTFMHANVRLHVACEVITCMKQILI